MDFELESATPEELWEHYMAKYKNPNPIARFLVNGFYRSLGKSLSSLPSNYRVLEVGCGPGESTKRIDALLRGNYFEASEFEQRLVQENLRRGFPVPLTQESVYEMHREDNEFDCVLLLEVLEHLDDFEAALAEIFRVAKETVVVSVPREPIWRILNFLRGKYWLDWGNTPGHINHWSAGQFVDLISRYGKIIAVHNPLPWTIVQATAKR